MSHIHQGPLATYNSLADSHLSGYFSNGRMKRHLKKAGLVNKQGEIVSESTYRLNMSRKEHKKQVKDMLAQAIVHKTLDLERTRQAEIKRKLEEISKIQLVHRVRASTGKKGDEDILPYLTPRSKRPESSPAYKHKGQTTQSKLRPNSAPGVRSESRYSEISLEEEGDVLYLDDDGRPMTPANVEHALSGEQSHIDPRHLHTLDTAAIRKYAMLMSQMEEGRGVTSPYMMSQVPLPPKARLSSRPLLSSRRVQSASPKRAVITTDSRIARLHRPETAKAHPGDLQTMCRVAMKYHGWALNLAREKMDPTQEVVVEQQHCGGNTLTVFKERLTPGSTFEFVSYRHRGYPFSLTLYLDGQMDSRVSTCCEYRHSRGAKIGGKQGHFSLLGVEGAIPCYKCQVAKGVLVRNKATPRRAKRPSERHMEEVIVVSTKKDEDHKDDGEVTEWRTKQGRPVGEDEGAVLIPVEDDDNHGDKTPKSPADKDTTYDDDFDDDKSSASSRSSSSSASDSETDSSTRQRDEVKKPQRKKEHFQPQETRGEEREAAPTPPPPPPPPAPATKAGEEEEGQKRGGGDGRGSQLVKVSNTNREIDDYSSDDGDEDPKAKVIDMENIEADDNQRVQQLRSRVSSSSSSSTTTTTKPPPEEERGTDNTVISVDLLDKQERDDEHARRDRERRAEERHKEEEDLLQRREERRASVRRASEVLRQEELFQHQQREQERQKKEKSKRQKDEGRELYQTQPDLETKRQVTMVLDRSDSDETDRGDKYDASHDRNLEAVESKNQVRAELDEIIDSYTEQLEKVEEGESEEEEDGEEEETEDDYKEKSEVSREEKSYDSQPESLTARSSRSAASSSFSRTSSTSDDTNRQIPTARSSDPEEDASDADDKEREEQREEEQREEDKEENQTQQDKNQQPSSKTDATLLGQNLTANNNNDNNNNNDDTAPPRAPSPFPPPAVYLHRRDTRNMEEAVVNNNTTLGSPQTTNSPPLSRPSSPTPPKSTTTTTSPPPSPSSPPLSPEPPQTDSALSPEASGVSPAEEDSPRATSPFPSAAVYEGRPKRDARPDDSSLSVSSWEREHPPVRARSPFPPAAVYEDRPRRGRGEEEGGEGGSLN